MDKQRNPGLWIAAAALAAVIVVMVSMPSKKGASPGTQTEATPKPRPGTPAQSVVEPAVSSTPRVAGDPVAPQPPIVSQPPVPAVVSNTPPRDADDPLPEVKPPTPADRENTARVIDNIQFALRDFRAALGENPVGTNAEITSSLLGNNLKQVKIPLPDGASVNGAGELCDPWGTPFFFHQQSGTKMEIRSAGSDRKLYTADDVVM